MTRNQWRIALSVLACLLLLLLIYVTLSRPPSLQRFYSVMVQGSDPARPGTLVIPVDTKLKEPRVFRWTGSAWEQQEDFCSKNENFKRIMLKTGAGETPMFIHEVKDDIYVSGALAKTGRWDSESVDPVMQALMKDPNAALLDVGSQLGVFTLTAAKMGRQALAVDPLLMNVKRLCRSAAEGGLSDKVTIVYAAVSDSRGMANFDFQQGNIGRTVVVESGSQKNTSNPNVIETVLLDDIKPVLDVMRVKSVVMKVDVEGHEYQVMSSGRELLTRFNVPYVAMEWQWHAVGPKRGEDMTEFFEKKKYIPRGEDLIDFFTERKFAPYTPKGQALDAKNFRRWGLNVVWRKKTE